MAPTDLDTEKEAALCRDDLHPREQISIDQCVSQTPGRLPNTPGREKQDRQHNGGSTFVDHASAFAQLFHQISLKVGETLLSKHRLESKTATCGVKIKSCHADNHCRATKKLGKKSC